MAYSVKVVFTVAIAIYAAVRSFRLTDSCLWFDEIFTVHAAEHSWGEIFNFLALDLIHPPLFYLILKVWMAIGGDGIFWLRLLPVLISVVAIFPFVKLCRELRLNHFATLLALFLVATNGALIKYAQEVRMYSLLMCLSLFSMWLFVRFANRGKGIAAIAIVNLLLVYSHYFGWFVIAGEIVGAFVLMQKPPRSKGISSPSIKPEMPLQRAGFYKMLAMTAAVFLAFLPWIFAVLAASRRGSEVTQNIGWMSRPGIAELWQFALDLVEPFHQQMTSADAGANYLIAIPMLLIVIGTIAAYFVLAERKLHVLPANADEVQVNPSPFLILVIFILIPAALAFSFSWLSPLSIWGTRHLIIVFPPLAILIGYCASRIGILAERKSYAFPSGIGTGQAAVPPTLELAAQPPGDLTDVTEKRSFSARREYRRALIANMSSIPAAAIIVLAVLAFIFVAARPTPQQSWCIVDAESKQLAATNEPTTIYAVDELTAYHIWFATRKQSKVTVNLLKAVPGVREDNAYFLPRGFGEIRVIEASSAEPLKSVDAAQINSTLLLLRSSTLIDHRRNREEFVTNESTLVQFIRNSGSAIIETKKAAAATEDVYTFTLRP